MLHVLTGKLTGRAERHDTGLVKLEACFQLPSQVEGLMNSHNDDLGWSRLIGTKIVAMEHVFSASQGSYAVCAELALSAATNSMRMLLKIFKIQDSKQGSRVPCLNCRSYYLWWFQHRDVGEAATSGKRARLN